MRQIVRPVVGGELGVALLDVRRRLPIGIERLETGGQLASASTPQLQRARASPSFRPVAHSSGVSSRVPVDAADGSVAHEAVRLAHDRGLRRRPMLGRCTGSRRLREAVQSADPGGAGGARAAAEHWPPAQPSVMGEPNCIMGDPSVASTGTREEIEVSAQQVENLAQLVPAATQRREGRRKLAARRANPIPIGRPRGRRIRR